MLLSAALRFSWRQAAIRDIVGDSSRPAIHLAPASHSPPRSSSGDGFVQSQACDGQPGMVDCWHNLCGVRDRRALLKNRWSTRREPELLGFGACMPTTSSGIQNPGPRPPHYTAGSQKRLHGTGGGFFSALHLTPSGWASESVRRPTSFPLVTCGLTGTASHGRMFRCRCTARPAPNLSISRRGITP